jgi:hypothetical protein
MNMKLIMTQYKKVALLATAVAVIGMGSIILADQDEAIRAHNSCYKPCDPCDTEDSLRCKLQALYDCCVATNKELGKQGHDAKKCCKKLRHEINEVEDQVEDCCSLLEELMVSQIDQTAECCSVTDARLGDPMTQIPSLQDCFIDVISYVNTNNDDVLTWLKRLYVLMYQVFNCTCCIG